MRPLPEDDWESLLAAAEKGRLDPSDDPPFYPGSWRPVLSDLKILARAHYDFYKTRWADLNAADLVRIAWSLTEDKANCSALVEYLLTLNSKKD